MKIEFIVVVIVMFLIWCSLLTFLWFKAEEITRDPCSICAKEVNKTMVCFTIEPGTMTRQKIFFPNYSILSG